MKPDEDGVVKNGVSRTVEDAAEMRQPDRVREKTPRATPSVNLVRTGIALANGAPSMRAAMQAAGLRSSANKPGEVNYTMGRALMAAATIAPSVGHSLRSHGRKADKVIDKTLTLKGDELPDSLQVQTAIAVKKLEQDANEPPEIGNGAHFRFYQRRIVAKAFAAGIRCAARLGLDDALATLESIVERDRTRFPYPVEFVAVSAPDYTMTRARSREMKPKSREE